MTAFRARVLLLIVTAMSWIAYAVLPGREVAADGTVVRLELTEADTQAEILVETLLPQFDRMLRELSGIRESRSVTEHGSITMHLYLDSKVDPASVAAQVREEAYRVYERVGGRLERPRVSLAQTGSDYSFVVSVHSPDGSVPDRQVLEHGLGSHLGRTAGVARVDTLGGSQQELVFSVSAGRLASQSVSLRDLTGGLRQAEYIAPAGRFRDSGTATDIVYDGRARTATEIAANTSFQLPGRSSPHGPGAAIEYHERRPDRIVRMNGMRHLMLGIVADGTEPLPAMSAALTGVIRRWNATVDLSASVIIDAGDEERALRRSEAILYAAGLLGFLLCSLLSGRSRRETLIAGVSVITAACVLFAIATRVLSACPPRMVFPQLMTSLSIAHISLLSSDRRQILFVTGLLAGLSLVYHQNGPSCTIGLQLLAMPALWMTRYLSACALRGAPTLNPAPRVYVRVLSGIALALVFATLPARMADADGPVVFVHLDAGAYASVETVDTELQAAANALGENIEFRFIQSQAGPVSGSLSIGLRTDFDREALLRSIASFNGENRRSSLFLRSTGLPDTGHRISAYVTGPTFAGARRAARALASEFNDAVLHFHDDSERLILRPRRFHAHRSGVDLREATLQVRALLSPAVHHKRISGGRETDIRLALHSPASDPEDLLSILHSSPVAGAGEYGADLASVFTISREHRPQRITHADREPSAHFSFSYTSASARTAGRALQAAAEGAGLPAGYQVHLDLTQSDHLVLTADAISHVPTLFSRAALVFLLSAAVHESWKKGLQVSSAAGVVMACTALLFSASGRSGFLEILPDPAIIVAVSTVLHSYDRSSVRRPEPTVLTAIMLILPAGLFLPGDNDTRWLILRICVGTISACVFLRAGGRCAAFFGSIWPVSRLLRYRKQKCGYQPL
ncbi:MAG: efflux RND transporter permease subunit [Spirochaetaceae bacterium]|nr:MAG: efflux RND transporter permease subunit [Spirochaetaceae bacterium]